ncbi:MAG: glycosyltransferase [Lachnospiraceae bacterium]
MRKVSNYFNSGVMLLNLEQMRRDHTAEVLIETKRRIQDSMLMDQNVLNLVFDNKILFLPIKYNFLYVNLVRSRDKYTMEEINETYQTEYQNLREALLDAVVVHFSSKDKPWKHAEAPLASEWYAYYLQIVEKFPGLAVIELEVEKRLAILKSLRDSTTPIVSVIMPVFNSAKYLEESLQSIQEQTLDTIEIICVNDGSTDESLEILNRYAAKDSRIRVLSQANKGQSAARNVGVEHASGQYLYFFDSDDLCVITGLSKMALEATKHALELLLFDGTSFYESKELEEKHPVYKQYYLRKAAYNGVYSGEQLYLQMLENYDYKVSPCLQFIRREFLQKNAIVFREGIIHEDNLFSFQVLLTAAAAMHISDILFKRRVRANSTMTSQKEYKNFEGYFTCLIGFLEYVNSHQYQFRKHND